MVRLGIRLAGVGWVVPERLEDVAAVMVRV
jgi:hypothetical protein